MYTVEEIVNRLQSTFSDEGLRFVTYDYDIDNRRLNVSLERFAPGIPVAFMLKGLQGTLHRYLDPKSSVVLQNYEVLPSAKDTESNSNLDLQKAILQGPQRRVRNRINFNNCLGVDLSSAKKGEASLALESLQNIAERQGVDVIAVKTPSESSRKVFKQWASINGFKYHKRTNSEDVWIVHLKEELPKEHDPNICYSDSKFDFIPLNLLVISSPEEK